MAHFDGVGPDAFLLLAQNRFEDSKAFYESHKAELKRLVTGPMGQLVECLAPFLAALDPQMLLVPSRIVSRLRRDTRYTRDKRMYRSNVWVCFTRPRLEFPHLWPVLWFECKPEESRWDAGVGLWTDALPAYMRFLRKRIQAGSAEFLAATEQALAAGAQLRTDPYKKDRAPEAPEALKAYLNAKSFHLIYTSGDMALLQSEALIERLKALYAAFAPMYRWYRAAADAYLASAEQ
ncbi:MAG: DUF2461 domain-containing protein [Oscillospiraceae bacterium]|jgi:uncharacterized protein (DUF2461 family)|nr:DUF2461 domain-containing protein [Oscillospiraceae bacterium]